MPRKTGKSPAFPMYASDFLSDINVKLMTMRQRGIYLTLLLHQWIEDSLPANINHLKTLCENSDGFEEDWEMVKHCFSEKKGRLYNPRLEVERDSQRKRQEKNSKNGKKGALKRWHSDSEAIATPLPSNKEIEKEVDKEVENKKTLTKTLNKEFEEDFWSKYPRRDNKKRAKDKYVQLRKSGTEKDDILDGLNSYIKQWRTSGTEPEFIPMASTWLHQERFSDELISGNKTIKKLTEKTTYNWMCKECGSEKTTEENIAGKYELCECGDSYYESRNMVLQEIAIEKNKKNKKPEQKASSKPDSDKNQDINSLVSSLSKSLGA